MRNYAFERPQSLARTVLLGVFIPVLATIFIAGFGACRGRPEQPLPLLVVSGPDDFTSFEIRHGGGEAIWRLEADTPTRVDAFVYGKVPRGFRQVVPASGAPRALDKGEDIEIESRIPNRVFLHKGYADSGSTIVILESAMRRLGADPDPNL